MLVFYDFEVFLKDWMVVIIEPMDERKTVIVNDRRKLIRFYEKHKNDIWIGYNSRHYDQFILKGIIAGFDPKEINDHIIKKDQSGYTFSSVLNKVFLINYDCMPNPPIGLKTLEGFMGSNIKESGVPFDIDRALTQREIEETIKYCTHDVEQTIEVFLKRQSEFDSHMQLVKTFGLPLSHLSKTQAQLSAEILNCTKVDRNDEFEFAKVIVPTLRLKKYDFVRKWFENAVRDCEEEMKKNNVDQSDEYAWRKYFYGRTLEINVCGVPHLFGWGGLHGAPVKPIHRKGLILHVDVNSFYPSIMIVYNLLTRNSATPEKYKEIYDHRLALKAAGKKKEQAPYKVVLNGTYGICKDKFSQAYDPRNANAVCVNGQLLLLDLLEHLEGHCELLQSNTDGLIIQIPDTDEAFEKIDDICYEWESRTGMTLGLDIIHEIYQKDVNNYLWIDDKDGERKGAYVKELSALDYDLAIVNRAMVDYMTKGIPVSYTVHSCDNLIDFQKIVKLSSKYEYVEHNDTRYDYKSYRVFASREKNDGKILKCRDGNRPAKFGNTPDRCFILNDDITGMGCPNNLDKQYYINLAKERLKQFGVGD